MTWKWGCMEVHPGLLQFILTFLVMFGTCLTALINLSLNLNPQLWQSVLTFVLGVLVPQPDVAASIKKAKKRTWL